MASTAPTTGRGRAAARPSGRPRPTPTPTDQAARPSRITEADKQATKSADALQLALAYSNRIGDGQVQCPGCNEWAVLEKKFKIFPDGGYKHYGSSGCHGDAITVLTADPLRLNFIDAVCLLVGKPTRAKVDRPRGDLPTLTVSSFKATVDVEVYNGVLAYGRRAFDGAGVKAAQEFYAQWHIDPEVVARSGAVYITDPKHFAAQILDRFGRDRLVACGLFKENDKGEAYSLVSRKWPLVEPHRHPGTGDVLNMQFRASNEQYAKYLAHKAGELPYDGNQKFINLRGIPDNAYIGAGLDEIEKLPPGSTVYIVEGFKDRLASETTGAHSYGVPGVDFRPPKKICDLLARHRVIVTFDGDDAGAKGMFGTVEVSDESGETVVGKDGKPLRLPNHNVPPHLTVTKQTSVGMLEYLQNNGVLDISYYLLTDGMDVTDRLVAKHAKDGCACTACTAMRTRLGL